MDRNYVVGLILIALVFFGWMLYVGQNMPANPPAVESDSLAIGEIDTLSQQHEGLPTSDNEPLQLRVTALDSLVANSDTLSVEVISVETDLYSAKLSTKGAGLTSCILTKFENYHTKKHGIEMVNSGGLSVPNFRFDQGRFNVQQLNFTADRSSISLSGENSDRIVFTYEFPTGESITKTYTFYGDRYSFDIEFEMSGVNSLGFSDRYEFFYGPGLKPTEEKVKNDLNSFKAFALMGGDLEKFDDFDDRNQIHEDLDGITDWVSTRSRFFTVALVPISRDASGLSINGSKRKNDEKHGVTGYCNIGIALKMRLAQRNDLFDSYTVYLGPLDYYKLKAYGKELENTLDLGWAIIRPFSKFVTWLLVEFHKVIPNYGVVIIIFTILMKIVFSPLSFISMKSMRKMQQIQPLINEIREKYKKDPQRMNQETMKLYKTEKINPVGGCLPMLPQIPIFYALFTVFRSTIEFRGAPFIWWMKDLSQPDPLYILPVLMAATMFAQQKMTMKDPKQKLMIYIFPVMFLFWGISFPMGLVLYWTIFNIFGFFEAIFIHKRHLPVTPLPATNVKSSGEPKNK